MQSPEHLTIEKEYAHFSPRGPVTLAPTIVDRFWIMRDWAEKARGKVIIAIVAPPALIDARRFAMTVAHNLGLRSDIFTSTAPALEWLLGGRK